jgi:hypothetical protein
VLPKKRWPAIKFKEKRAIQWEEHQAIVVREQNPERKAFYQLAWHLGASQSPVTSRDDTPPGNTEGYLIYANPDSQWEFWGGKEQAARGTFWAGPHLAALGRIVGSVNGPIKTFYERSSGGMAQGLTS